MSDVVLYQELHLFKWAVWGFGALGLGMIVVAGIAPVGSAGGWLVLIGSCVVIVMWVLAGVQRKHQIVCTRSTLRVGTETFEPADFDFAFGVQPLVVMTPEEQRRVEHPYVQQDGQEFRVAGKAWGRPPGASELLLRDAATGALVTIFTRHPQLLDPILTEWLEHPPPPPDDTSAPSPG